MPYRELNPRTQLEQTVAADLRLALVRRGAKVTHHGTPQSHAPSTAPADISIDIGRGRTILVEVAKRNDATEFESIVSHLERWVAAGKGPVHVLYSAIGTSARMARLVHNENERREANHLFGRILFLKLDDLEAFLNRWASLPSEEAPLETFVTWFDGWRDAGDDLAAARTFLAVMFPTWKDKEDALRQEADLRLFGQQEGLKRDIRRLEDAMRKIGITGQRAHKALIYLFFMALYEDRRGPESRATSKGFKACAGSVPNADRAQYAGRTAHYILTKQILSDPDVSSAGIGAQYEKVDLSDTFVLSNVIPIFEKYSFADVSIDAIGAVFEALARRAEKDNRIGQFFTPETAVAATTRMTRLRPLDIVLDPACGTGRFLIRAMDELIAQVKQLGGADAAASIETIKRDHLLGSDIDPWIAIIAKMNMYIHGDGKTNIQHVDGLSLRRAGAFGAGRANPVIDGLDIVITNPPLGDVDFVAASDHVADQEGLETEGARKQRASAWLRDTLPVVPHTVREEQSLEKARAKRAQWQGRLEAAIRIDDASDIEKARRWIADWDGKIDGLVERIGAGDVTYDPAGRTTKGGALFLSAIGSYLKPVRDAALPVEWRGGVLGIILDEAILNTPDFQDARSYIRGRFFIKAVISLPRDAFKDLARTTAKTSILILIRKPDDSILQREPVFYARAEHIGPTSTDPRRQDDLIPLVGSYDGWAERMIEEGNRLGVPAEADRSGAMLEDARGPTGPVPTLRTLDPTATGERLDEAFWAAREIVRAMPAIVTLGDVAELVSAGRVPPQRDYHPMATIVRDGALVRPKGEIALS